MPCPSFFVVCRQTDICPKWFTHRSPVKSILFRKRTSGLSTNFLRRKRNFRCPALHFLSFVGKLIFVRNTSHTGPRELNYVNLPINDKNWRAGHLKFLVRLEKLVERRGVRFCVAVKTKAGRAKCKISVLGFSYPFSSENCSLGLCPR